MCPGNIQFQKWYYYVLVSLVFVGILGFYLIYYDSKWYQGIYTTKSGKIVNISREYRNDSKSKIAETVLEKNSNNRKDSIFYGIATHHSKIEKQKMVMMTWGKRIPAKNLYWYSDVDAPYLNSNVIVNPAGESYREMFTKMIEFWKSVYNEFGEKDSFNWYLRLWEDNYVLTENLERFLNTDVYEIYSNSENLQHLYSDPMFRFLNWNVIPDFNKPIVIANVSPYVQSKGEIFPLLGGGPGWVFNNKALKLFAENVEYCIDKMKFDTDIECKNVCEDVMIGECLRSLGVQIVPFCGAFGHPPWNQYSCSIDDENLRKKLLVDTNTCSNGNFVGSCPLKKYHPLIFHYMEPEQMSRVETILYN